MHDKLTRSAKLALAELFVIIEEKFIQSARIEDILVIRPDVENGAIICGIARYENMEDRGFNEKLFDELEPYFALLKQDFTAQVLYKFVTKTWDKEMYLKDQAELITDRLIAKIRDPEYTPPKIKM
jgi:hypothetical protein